MDAFFVSVEELKDPSLKGLPVVVGGRPESRGVVAAASYPARRYGIHSAMPMARAVSLCPGLIRLSGDGHRYSDYSKQVFRIMGEYSPLLEKTSIDEGYLDLSGTGPLLGHPFQVARNIHHRIQRELSLPCSIGLSSSKLASKVASDLAKPNGLLAVFAGQEARFLAPLPVGRIPGIGPTSQKKLFALGIRRVGDLLRLNEIEAIRYFGSWGPVLLERAAGVDNRPVRSSRGKRSSIGAESTFPIDLTCHGKLRNRMRLLVERSGRRLRRAGLTCRCVTVKLRTDSFMTRTASTTMERATSIDPMIYQIALQLMGRLWKGRPPVRLLGVRLSQLEEKTAAQPGLFDLPDPQDSLMKEIDNVRDRFGHEALQTGVDVHGDGNEIKRR